MTTTLLKANARLNYPTLALLASLLGAGCAAHRPSSAAPGSTAILATTSVPDGYYEKARQTVAPATVTTVSKDATYGFAAENPIKVGGGASGGVRGEQSYLNALRGPAGQPVTYRRQGSCCPFKTPNGLLDNTGLLDAYLVTWEGNDKPLKLYINMYDKGDVFIPVGLTAAQ